MCLTFCPPGAQSGFANSPVWVEPDEHVGAGQELNGQLSEDALDDPAGSAARRFNEKY